MAKQALLSFDGFPVLQQVAGEGRGRSYELSIDEVKIGRADQNDIVIAHDSISREHAHIEKSEDGQYVIFDNGSKNGLIVNGTKVEASPLKHGDLIQLGAFSFKFLTPLVEEKALMETQPPGRPVDMSLPRSKRPIIYGGAVLLLVVVYLYSGSSGENKTDEPSSDTNQVVGSTAERFQASAPPDSFVNQKDPSLSALEDPVLKSAEQEMTKLDFGNQSIQEAELYFRRGQREYFSKNWHRAIDSFSTSLAIYKRHPMSEFYLKASIHEAEKEAKVQMEMAVKYFESLQYKRSIYHFNQVMLLLSHRQNEKVVADSKKYIEIATRKLQASELFP